ncbi:MAG TPA: cupredoxin domain-containing protein [Actinospica sp.]|nr:cupredoxin domain-containing protein [Actinospica sp.]
MRRRLFTPTLLVAGSALLLAGCSSSGSSSSGTSTATTSSAAAAADTIVIKSFSFSPATLTVAPGAKVTVTNEDSVTHTVTSTASPRAFDTGGISAGATMTFTAPSKAGTYSYICTIHTYMHGTLTVS